MEENRLYFLKKYITLITKNGDFIPFIKIKYKVGKKKFYLFNLFRFLDIKSKQLQ